MVRVYGLKEKKSSQQISNINSISVVHESCVGQALHVRYEIVTGRDILYYFMFNTTSSLFILCFLIDSNICLLDIHLVHLGIKKYPLWFAGWEGVSESAILIQMGRLLHEKFF